MASDQLETVLGLQFQDRQLLEQALVHRSFVNEKGWSPSDSYERMEYLGDAVLELVISEELYRRYPDLTEGELTKGRAALVCGEALARLARKSDLGNFILLGKGEEAVCIPAGRPAGPDLRHHRPHRHPRPLRPAD